MTSKLFSLKVETNFRHVNVALSIEKSEVFRGMHHIFLILNQMKAVLTSTHNICFEQKTTRISSTIIH